MTSVEKSHYSGSIRARLFSLSQLLNYSITLLQHRADQAYWAIASTTYSTAEVDQPGTPAVDFVGPCLFVRTISGLKYELIQDFLRVMANVLHGGPYSPGG